MLRRHFVYTAVLVTLLAACSAAADSLWPLNSTSSLFADAKAKKVGDLITVLIVETTTATQNASTDYSKDFSHENAAGVGKLLKLIPELGYSVEQQGKSSGETTMSNNLATKLTATVTKVLENGNLVIEGHRSIVTNGEKQDAKLTATVRPLDVSASNTVPSTSLADVKVECTGKGAIGDRQKEGFISKLLKWLF